jgi:hypothetical protein
LYLGECAKSTRVTDSGIVVKELSMLGMIVELFIY